MNPYFEAYMAYRNESDINKIRNYEYINWITKKHKEFKKLNHIPEDFTYTDQQRKKFIEFLYKSIDK